MVRVHRQDMIGSVGSLHVSFIAGEGCEGRKLLARYVQANTARDWR